MLSVKILPQYSSTEHYRTCALRCVERMRKSKLLFLYRRTARVRTDWRINHGCWRRRHLYVTSSSESVITSETVLLKRCNSGWHTSPAQLFLFFHCLDCVREQLPSRNLSLTYEETCSNHRIYDLELPQIVSCTCILNGFLFKKGAYVRWVEARSIILFFPTASRWLCPDIGKNEPMVRWLLTISTFPMELSYVSHRPCLSPLYQLTLL